MSRLAPIALVVCCLFVLSGCQPTQTGTNPAGDGGHGHGHGHSHGHSHSHDDAGPHGGHLVELGEEAYHVEWLHDDDTGEVTLHILDGDAKEDVGIPAESVTIVTKINDESTEYVLAAVDRTEGDTPMASKFQLQEPSLIESLKLAGEGLEATVTLEIEAQSYTGKFEHHDHGGHGHAH